MSTKELVNKKLYKEFSLSIPYQEIEDLLNNKINEIAPTVALPGFRKGKVPINLVKKKYENNLLNEILQKLVENKISSLISEKKIKPFRQPNIKIDKFEKNKPLEVNVKIDISPDFEIFDFKKIQLTKYEINIDKKTYDDNYDKYLKSQKIYKKLTVDRPIKNGDKIFINISSSDKSIPDFFKNQKNMPIETDSDYQILPNLSEEIIKKKLKSGDKTEIKFDLSKILKKDKKTLIDFLIEINNVEEKNQLKIDKDFLDKNNLKSEKEFKDRINESLKFQYENYTKEIEKKMLMDSLDEKNKFDIPDGILKEEFEIIWQRLQDAKKNNQLDPDDKELDEKKLKKRYQDISKRRVKLAVLIQKIAEENKISVEEKELIDGMSQYASQYPGQEKEIFDYFKKNPSQIENIRGKIFEQKVIDFVISKVKKDTKKITIKEFNKLQEETFSLNKN